MPRPVTDGAPTDSSTTAIAVRRLYALALLTVLVVVQARAAWLQIGKGYRPFSHAPGRVPYSWDMFAIRMDRCSIRWDPPLEIEGARVSTWHDRAFPIEFDTVYDRAGHYGMAARSGCSFRTEPKTESTLVCIHSDGKIDERAFDCP
jgi:hypothetical protein